MLGKPKFPPATTDEFWSDLDGQASANGLVKLIGPRSWTIFNMLNLQGERMDWLEKDVDCWILSEGYQEFERFSRGLRVVNDTAERGIKLIQDFVAKTTDEQLRQDMLLVVSEHHKLNTADKMTKRC